METGTTGQTVEREHRLRQEGEGLWMLVRGLSEGRGGAPDAAQPTQVGNLLGEMNEAVGDLLWVDPMMAPRVRNAHLLENQNQPWPSRVVQSTRPDMF